jgi:hypothetical protein
MLVDGGVWTRSRRTICGLLGSVDTHLEPRRKSVGARIEHVERANVLDSIMDCFNRDMLWGKKQRASTAQRKLSIAPP